MTANFNFPDTRPDHNLCRPALVKSMADEGIEIVVSDPVSYTHLRAHET